MAPLPPRRDPKTTLSIGESKAKHFHSKLSMVLQFRRVESHGWEVFNSISFLYVESWENDSRQNGDNNQPKTASIRSRPISSRITTAELEELFQRQAELSPVYQDKVNTTYFSAFLENKPAN